ncbi:MAG TPA: CoA transferase [Cyclobacteriaceae bacterium]|nr:CoA transferase [Cyclobacteriaceae bacterium]
MALLKDIRVLELASVLAGPSVGQFFAELGAEVIKVENLQTGGDVTRTWKAAGEPSGDLSAYFCSCNWGKKSVAVDLATNAGKNLVADLASTSDIVIASYKPGDAQKLGVSYEQLVARNDKLIYGQISGYGSENDRVGYDAVIQAESGFMDLNGEKDGPPMKMPVALIDILAAHHLKEAILLAMIQLYKTGKGSLVEVSLIQAAVASLANQASNWLVHGKLPARQGSSHPNIAPYGDAFETKDGKKILLAVGSDRQFNDLIAILGLDGNIGRFSTNQSRVVNREALNELLATKIQARTSADLLEKIHRAKIPGGVIQNVQQAFIMPEVQAMLTKGGGITGVRTFAAASASWKPNTLSPPPHFGEHNAEFI